MPIFPPTQRCNAVPAVSDLASSIPTGRYHSQKDRLGCSQVGHVMYLVEGDLREQQTLSPKAIASAVCSTMLGSGFHLLLSPNVEGTVRLLEGLTRAIRQCYVTQQIVLRPARAMSLATWNVFQSGNRQQTVGDVFLMMLQQVHGCSRDKAEAIQDAFPTPSALRHRYQALARAGQSAAAVDGLLAGVTGDGSLRPLGLPASALLSQCFGGSS